jgi:DNA-binding transcriptional LysR family regulator
MAQRDIRSLDVGMLRTFDALMRERSVSRAATRLFLSQPAVSASLNRLRDTFGDPLFTRTAHGVEPTARAQALAGQVERLLADLSAMLEPGEGFDPAASQRIFRISGGDYASHLLLPTLANELVACGSRVRIYWETSSFLTLTERLRKGDFDIAVLPRLQPPSDCESALLYEDRYVVAVRRGHPTMGHGATSGVTLEAFCASPHVFLGYGSSALDDLIDQVLARLGHTRNMSVAMTSFGQIVDLLAQTDHVAVMPLRVADRFRDLLAVHPLPFELQGYRSVVCWNRRSNSDAGVLWLKDALLRIGRIGRSESTATAA